MMRTDGGAVFTVRKPDQTHLIGLFACSGRSPVTTRTREQCGADITAALAAQRLADLVGDEEAEQAAEQWLDELFDEFSHIPQQRKPSP
jgi:hypothetical protein